MEARAERQVHLLDYWQVLLKRRWIVYSCLLLVTGLVTLGSFLVRPMYTATVQLQIEKYRPNVLPFQDVMTSYTDFRDDFYETQSRLIQSRSVARAVVRKLDLTKQPPFLISEAKREELHLNQEDVELRVADRLRGMMSVELIRNSRLVNVSFVSPNAELSARVANAVADAYIQFNAQTAYNATEQATESMSRQIETLRGEISEKERQLQEYARKQEIIPLDDRQNVTTQKLNDLNIAYTKAQTARIEKEAKYATMKDSQIEELTELMNNPLLQTLSAKHAELEREYASMSKRFKPDWPAMKRLKSELDKTRLRLDAEREDLHKRLLGEAREHYLTALKEEQSLGDALAGQKTEAQRSGLRAIEYNNLKSEVENRRKTLEAMVKRQTETGATAGMSDNPVTNVRIVDQAEVPRFPSSPRKAFNFLLSLVAGLGLGVGLAFFFDYMDDSVNDTEDLGKAAGLACLGLIPAHDQAARRLRVVRSRGYEGDDNRPEIDLAALRDARSLVSEAFREVRTSLLISSPGRPPKNLLVTSSQPREGKSATALNLAITLSQLSRRVLLVDADLRRPRLHKALGVSNDAGLSNLLSGAADLASLTIACEAPGLFLLASGPPPPNPAELLDSAEFVALVERLAADPTFDYVIFDSPPILSVADAAIMASRMDGVILVVQASVTPRDNVARAAEKLRQVKARILGALLNQVDLSGRGRYHPGYYAYYGRDEETDLPSTGAGPDSGADASPQTRARGKTT
ncbi:MAG TPA: polysaccharide biosynthesis tyrosine autokinase [Candidatus Polarisedimenticolia bacterium]|nr:polysaccharide biosynthesis tyrosine autokinase [Candidatus Polarisedimenticolia bacterium]